jgi:autotransporter family porin
LAVASTYSATAIFAATVGPGGFTIVTNSGNLTAIVAGSAPYSRAIGISAEGGEANTPATVVNSGTISASGGLASFGIYAATDGANSPISITNSGTIDPAIGIFASTQGQGSPITIHNSGTVFGEQLGISADTKYGATTIFNSGNISAGSLFAIDVYRAPFETKLTSTFGGGNDLFRNEEGGTVLAATNRNASEYSSFVGLERFENKGLISLHDGQVGDVFRISNTVGGTDLSFVGSGKSTLAIDAFLGGPGSNADNFIIDGNVAGTTALQGADANKGPGVLNKEGIPVIFVNGPGVTGDEFFLKKPIDTGFFNYDLFFRPTGSGVFELRSFLGGGVFVLPQLETAMQDMWHQGSDTWFAKVDVTFGEDIDGVGGKAGMRVAW